MGHILAEYCLRLYLDTSTRHPSMLQLIFLLLFIASGYWLLKKSFEWAKQEKRR